MDPNLSWSVHNGALIPATRWMKIEAVPDLEWTASLRKIIERKFEPLTLRFIKKGEGLRWFQYGSMFMKPVLSLNKGTTPPPDHMQISGSDVVFQFISEQEFNEMEEQTKLKLFVHGFSTSITPKDLAEYFEKLAPGKVVHSQVAPSSGNLRSYFGYVLFKDRPSLSKVLQLPDQHIIKGEVVKIQEYDSKVRKGGAFKNVPQFKSSKSDGVDISVKSTPHPQKPNTLGIISSYDKIQSTFAANISDLSLEGNFAKASEIDDSPQYTRQKFKSSKPTRSKTCWSMNSLKWEESKSGASLGYLSHLYRQDHNSSARPADSSSPHLHSVLDGKFVLEVLSVPSKLITIKDRASLEGLESENLVFNLRTPGSTSKTTRMQGPPA